MIMKVNKKKELTQSSPSYDFRPRKLGIPREVIGDRACEALNRQPAQLSTGLQQLSSFLQGSIMLESVYVALLNTFV